MFTTSDSEKTISAAGTEGPGVSISEERQSVAENSGTTIIYNPYAALSIEQQRQKLPVFKVWYVCGPYCELVAGETGLSLNGSKSHSEPEEPPPHSSVCVCVFAFGAVRMGENTHPLRLGSP